MKTKIFFLYILSMMFLTGISLGQSSPWKTDGNSNTSGTDFIGTTDSRPVEFRTGNQTQVKLGTDGSFRLSTLTGSGPAILGTDANGTILRLTDPSIDSLFDCSLKLWDGDGNYITPACFLGTTNEMSLRLFTDSLERMRIAQTGEVGIGTLTPKSAFQVGEDMPFGVSYRGPGLAGIGYLMGFNARLVGTDIKYVDAGYAAYQEFDPVNGVFVIGMAGSGTIGANMNTPNEMTLTKSGQIGIGTRTPSAALHLYKTNGAAEIRVQHGSPLGVPVVSLWAGQTGGSSEVRLGSVSANYDQQNVRSELAFKVNPGTSATSEQTILRMNKEEGEFSGRLGIGRVVDSQHGLAVNGAARFGTGANPANELRVGHDGTDGFVQLSGNQAGKLKLDGGDVLIMDRLGVGTSSFVDGSRNYRLSVEGHIRARAARVYPGWSDYVFDNDYKLMPLRDVQQYILQNGHLPGIPSAEDVALDGVDVGEMEALLLAKIEELTLHVIRLEGELERVKGEIEGGGK
jgi:hypothetical protein